MNLHQTNQLLAYVASVDNRKVDDAVVVSWQEILDGLALADCIAAATAHFRDRPDAYLMPGHVHRGALERVRERKRIARETREAERLAIEAADPTRTDRSEAVSDAIDRLRQMLPDGHPDKLRRPEWVEWERSQDRTRRAAEEPNPHFRGLPPPGGWPVDDEPREDQP